MVAYPHAHGSQFINRPGPIEINWSGEGLPSRFRNITAGLAFVQVPQFAAGKIEMVYGIQNTNLSAQWQNPSSMVIGNYGLAFSSASATNPSFQWILPTGHPFLSSPYYTSAVMAADPTLAGGWVAAADNNTTRIMRHYQNFMIVFDASNNNYNIPMTVDFSNTQKINGTTSTARMGSDRIPILSTRAVNGADGTGGANNEWTMQSISAIPSLVNLGAIGYISTCGQFSPGGGYFPGYVYLIAIWARKLSDEEDQFWHHNPFCIFRPKRATWWGAYGASASTKRRQGIILP